jgi:hypothetical protein
MTRSTPHAQLPGRLLLNIARLLFDESVVTIVVAPTIADLQQELEAAGDSRLGRLLARWRGCAAFWKLVAVAPFAFHAWPPRPRTAVISPGISAGLAVSVTVLGVIALTAPALRAWMLLVAAGGCLSALAIHRWYSRHPGTIGLAERDVRRQPEINLSSIPVEGNLGGLMFMVGSMVVLVAGLPAWRWYFLAAPLGGILIASLLGVWHLAHPSRRRPENSIVLR